MCWGVVGVGAGVGAAEGEEHLTAALGQGGYQPQGLERGWGCCRVGLAQGLGQGGY